MSLSIVLRPEAEADLKSARQWYEKQRDGLGDEFIDAIDAVFARIEAMPELYAVALKGVRRVKAHRFLLHIAVSLSERWAVRIPV